MSEPATSTTIEAVQEQPKVEIVPAEEAAPTSTSPAETVQPAASEGPSATTSEGSEEEPQNALTKKFTDEEWNALKAFRAKLGDAFTEAYTDKPDAWTTPIILWGVTIDPNGKKDARASVILMKFLRARDLDLKGAHDMLVSTLKWRGQFQTDEIIREEFPDDVFGKLGKVKGTDKEGRPVTYNLYGASDIKQVFGDVRRFIRWRVKFMEESIKLLDFETVDQMIQIHDYEGVSFLSRDASQKAAASEATNLFQAYYPEFLSMKFFINVPNMMSWVFWLFKPLIPAKTLAKFSMVGTGPRTIGAALLPHIDASELPNSYGGQAENLV